MTLRRRQTDSDSNANSSGVYPGKPVRTYRNARGLVVAVEQQNTVGSPATLKTLTTTYAYDPLDRLREVRDAKPTTATPPGPNVTTIAWDTMGRMISLTSPDNGQTLYDYDLAGNLGRKQNAKGNLVRYNYDYHRLRGIDYPSPGTADVTLSYYESTEPPGMRGRLRSRTDEAGAETFQYDTHGNVSQTSWTPAGQPAPVPPPTVTSYNYDFMGVLRSLTVPGETLTYSYNSAGQVTGVSGESPGSNVVYALNVLYNEFGQRTQMVTAGTTKYTYDPVTRRLKNLDSTAGNPLQRLIYDYDFVGNVKRLRNAVTFPGGTSPVIPGPTDQTFVYDHLHQLTGATGTYTGVGSLGGRTYSLTITYNEIGNIIRKNQLLQNRATVGGTNQTVSSYNDVYSYASAARPHAPSSIGGASATYDADGNQLTFASTPSRTMTWSEDDRLKSFTRGSTSQTYLYRADGQRAIKRTPSAFHYANPFYVNRPGMQSTRHVMLGNERIASVITQAGATSGQTVYYHGDHLQSSHYTLDGNGNPVQHNEYIPTGETWLDEIASGQSSKRVPYLFNSKELDESGLYYMDARYYDPRYSMWMSTDPALRSYAGGSPNGGLTNPRNLGLYGYSYNNPVAFRDPTGLSPALAEKAYREGLASPPPRRGSRGGTAAAWAALSNRPPEQVASEPVDYASMSSSMPMSCADCDRGEDVAPLPRGAAELEPSKLDTTPIRERNVTLKGGGAMKGIPGVEGNVIVNISRHGIAVGLEGEFSLGSGFDSGMSFGAETSDYYPTTGVSFPKFGDSAEISFGPFGIKVPNRRSTAGSVDPGFLGSLRKGRLPGGLGAWSPVVTATWLAW
jgi:RHS repeat-associated protein